MSGAGKAAALVAAVAVSASGGPAAGAASGSKSTPKHQARSVRLSVRQNVTVKLPVNPSTGFHWVTRHSAAKRVLRLRSRHFAAGKCAPGVVGCGGHEIYKFRAVGAGRTSLVLALMPPGSGRAVQTYRLTARVR